MSFRTNIRASAMTIAELFRIDEVSDDHVYKRRRDQQSDNTQQAKIKKAQEKRVRKGK